MPIQTLQQQRAAHALGQVKSWVPLNDGKKLKSRTSELPFMIHANGLGQAAAFFRSKGNKDGYAVVFAGLQSWLVSAGRPFAGKTDLMQAIVDADLYTYRCAQAEAMAYMDWVRKFASAYLGEQA
ncbi:type III-B CRISPR module-associated protein Cmr5 [Sphaerotilus uruguayifluvii]|uniref:CRISPR type III-B/RAMP module-associated protein Cmr5 n=1 Tax=Sphaerotilus uruguayifluvii TaxID=2735897 RepID=A0ABX2G6U7_9BURK|nr:type III-B CRISPR module-associated protein Cmr5 [Leptothrix sp. C29]NRT58053.1 CRISPR-associated protein Cmr5 [Leptothrix sp. C29]